MGTVSEIQMSSLASAGFGGGSGYVLTTVSIDGGEMKTWFWTFIFNETITGSTSGVTGRVKI